MSYFLQKLDKYFSAFIIGPSRERQRRPLQGPILFIFCSFRGKFGQIIDRNPTFWVGPTPKPSLPWEILDPPMFTMVLMISLSNGFTMWFYNTHFFCILGRDFKYKAEVRKLIKESAWTTRESWNFVRRSAGISDWNYLEKHYDLTYGESQWDRGRVWWRRACVVKGAMHCEMGCVWCRGGIHGGGEGASHWYASYWNAFLFNE